MTTFPQISEFGETAKFFSSSKLWTRFTPLHGGGVQVCCVRLSGWFDAVQVWRERVRIDEWTRDYDKARTRRMRKTHFRRALDLCNLRLQVWNFTHDNLAVAGTFREIFRRKSHWKFSRHLRRNLQRRPGAAFLKFPRKILGITSFLRSDWYTSSNVIQRI